MSADRNPSGGPDGGPFAVRVEDLAPARLPRGRHQLRREVVARHQRSRLMAGAIDSLGDRGYLATSVADIIAAAGVSRYTFYDQFADKEDCFLAAYDATIAWWSAEVLGALPRGQGWPRQVRAGVVRALELFAADNRLARLCTVEVFFAGVRAEIRHRALVDRLSLRLGVGRGERAHGAELPPHLEPTLIGGALALVARQLGGGEGDLLVELAPELTEYLLAPYLGGQAARRVAAEAPQGPSVS